jgi:hypothetical protein
MPESQSRTTHPPRLSNESWRVAKSIIADARVAVKNNTPTEYQQRMVLLMTEGGEKGLSKGRATIADARLAVKNNTPTEAQQRIMEGNENGLSIIADTRVAVENNTPTVGAQQHRVAA